MRRGSALLASGALLVGAGEMAHLAGYGPGDACGVEAVDKHLSFCQPPKEYFENTGSTRVQLATDLGSLFVTVDPEVTMDRTLDSANAFSYSEIVKQISLPGIAFVDWEAYEKDGVVYVTQKRGGKDVGIDASKLTFTPLAEETDMQDGTKDHMCATPRESPDYTGCEFVDYAQNGWVTFPGIGADNDGEIWTRLERIRELKISDNLCSLENEIAPIFQDVLGDKYDFSAAAGVNLTARVMTEGLVKIQIATALGVSVQKIVVNLSDEEYERGPTYSERLAQEDNLGDLSDKDDADDWCVTDNKGEAGMTVPEQKLRKIAMAALAPAGYDVQTDLIDLADPELARLPDDVLAKYGEEFGRG